MRCGLSLLSLILVLVPLSADTVQKPKEKTLSDLRTHKFGSDWPRFLGPTGDNVSTEKGIIKTWPEKGLKVVWHTKVGEGYSMPVISRGRLFHFERIPDTNTARLRCFRSETGKELWKFTYPTTYTDKYNYDGGPRTSPTVSGNRVVIYGPEGMLHCLEASNGKLLWKVDTTKRYNVIQNFFGVGCSPAIEGKRVIVQVGGSPKGSDKLQFQALKGNGSGIVAFDLETGQEVYKKTDELASYSSPTFATIKGRRWGFMFTRGGLVGFGPKEGTVHFRFPWRADILESVNAANPVVVDDKVLISETYGPGSAVLQIVDKSYKVLWKDDDKDPAKKAFQCHWNTPIHHNGYVYGCSGRNLENADIRCVDLKTGKVMWRVGNTTRSSLLKVDDYFIAQREIGSLILFKANPRKFEVVSVVPVLDPKTGKSLLQRPCWGAPVLSHGLLYVRGAGRLVCLELIRTKQK
ncbi:MAG: PQQ-binding-like beta-propeller repeat protein [Gemmataceae bacterium]